MMDSDFEEKTFNKDVAFLMELQRLEILAHNFAIEGKQEERLRVLKRWKGILTGLITEDQTKRINKYLIEGSGYKHKGQINYDVEKIDALHDYLNYLNTAHKLQLNKKDSDLLEPEADWKEE